MAHEHEGHVDVDATLDRAFADTLRAAHTAQRSLIKTLFSLHADLRGHGRFQVKVEQAGINVMDLSGMLRTLTTAKYYNEQCPDRAKGLAQQVFHIPEILELVLLQLPLYALLLAQQVNKQFWDAIRGSARLRSKLCLSWDGQNSQLQLTEAAQLPLHPVPQCSLASETCLQKAVAPTTVGLFEDEDGIHFSFGATLPIIGATCRKMYICTPPITSMNVYVNYCNGTIARKTWLPHDPIAVLSRWGGITMGELLDEAKRLHWEHRYCPMAYRRLHDDEGNVMVNVTFRAAITLGERDPILTRRRKAVERALRVKGEEGARRNKMTAFGVYKQTVTGANGMIPTFEEFEKAHEGQQW